MYFSRVCKLSVTKMITYEVISTTNPFYIMSIQCLALSDSSYKGND